MRTNSKWKWHVDELFVRINGVRHYLRKAVDHEGKVLESAVTKDIDKRAALKLLRKLMKRRGQAKETTTNRFSSHWTAMRGLGTTENQTNGSWLDNRVEN